MLPIGLSNKVKNVKEEMFEKYAKAGISHMEISNALQFPPISCADTLKWSEKYNVKLWSLHLPFGTFDKIDPSSSDSSIRSYTLKYHFELIDEFSEIGIKLFVVHPSGEPITDSERNERMRLAKESMSALAEKAASHGAVIAVENLPRTCLGKNSDEINELISANPKLKVCFDTNHLLKEDISDFIKKTGKNIVTVHISDYDFTDEKHWLPGEGKVDWQKVYGDLTASGYNGPWLYEVGFEAPNTIIRSRNLTCSDFVRNAEEIFEGKPLTVLGTPKV